MDAILTFINSQTFRWILGLVFGKFWKGNEATVTKAAPFLIFVGNVFLALAAAVAGVVPAQAGPLNPLFIPGLGWLGAFVLNPLVSAAVGTVLSVGTHSGLKNVWEWIQNGAQLVVKKVP
jgi:hypothetical protein